MKVIYKKIEYSEGDILEYRDKKRGIIKFGPYNDHEGYCQYVHLGFYVLLDIYLKDWDDEGSVPDTLPDAIDIEDAKKVE